MKRRTITTILLIAALVFLVFALVACAGQTRCAKHNWQPYKVVDGNIQTEMCSNCGVTRRLCYPFPHTYDSFADNGDGTHTAHCSECDLDDVVEHNFNGQPTSIHDAVICDDCGAKFYAGTNHQLVDGNGDLSCDICGGSTACNHNYEGEIATPAQCETSGVFTYTCTLCGDTYDETITATGHNYKCEVVDATCLQDGYTLFTCSNCDDSYRTHIVPSSGHNEEIVVIKEATCITSGLVTHKCTEPGCGYSYDESIELDYENGHVWANSRDIVFKVEEMCNGATIDARCILCQTETELKIVSNISEHDWELNTRTEAYTPVSCIQDGVNTYYCNTCNEYLEEIIPRLDHDYVKTHLVTDCTKEFGHSYYAWICSYCDEWDEMREEEAEAKPHTDEDGDNICDVCKRSLCEYCEDMDNDHLCDACGKPYTEFCDDNDFNGDSICDVCGNNFCQHYDDNWDYYCDCCGCCICSHSYTYQEFYGVNCDDGGWLVYICGECYIEVSRTEIAPGEHAYEYYEYFTKRPNCTEDGEWCFEKYCYQCYYYECEYETIPALGHNYVIVYMTESTCGRHGEILYCCANCGDLYIEELELSGHTAKTITLEASCFADGRVYEICSDCGIELNVIEVLPAYNAHVNENGDFACDRCGWSYCDRHEAEIVYNQSTHYEQCINCGAIIGDTTNHYDDNEDGSCDGCDSCLHSFTEYEYDSLSHWSKCDNCDAVYICEHQHAEIGRQEATCGDFGGIIYGCAVCDHTFVVETEEATGKHINVEVYFNAEKHWSICTDCGIVFNESRHEMYYEDDSYRGCFASYAYLWICYDSDCGYSYYEESDAYGCTYDYYWDEVCWACGKCDSHYLGEEYDANNDGVCDICEFCISGHSFSTEPIEVKTPTCDSRYGYSKYECENCKYVLTKDYTLYLDTIINNKIEAGETDWSICRFDWHNYEAKEVVAPNCGYNGYTIFVCVDCGWETEGNYTATVGEHINEDENIWYCDFCGICICENHVDEDEDYRCDICDSSTCEWHDTYYKSNHDYHWLYCMQCRRAVSDFMPHEETYDDESGAHYCAYCGHHYCESFLDVDGDNLCDRMGCGYSNCIAHTDENNDYHCDQCSKSMCPEHVSDGNYYHYFYHFSHAQFCVVCGELFYDEECYDWDYDNYCDFCGDSTCGHYDYPDESGWYTDGYCDNCYVDMSTIEPDCLHEHFSAYGNSGRYHYGYCVDCGKYIYAHHDYDEVLDKEVPIEGETCYKDMYYTCTCPCCGYVEKEVRVDADHKDEDEDYCCDECGYCWW